MKSPSFGILILSLPDSFSNDRSRSKSYGSNFSNVKIIRLLISGSQKSSFQSSPFKHRFFFQFTINICTSVNLHALCNSRIQIKRIRSQKIVFLILPYQEESDSLCHAYLYKSFIAEPKTISDCRPREHEMRSLQSSSTAIFLSTLSSLRSRLVYADL